MKVNKLSPRLIAIIILCILFIATQIVGKINTQNLKNKLENEFLKEKIGIQIVNIVEGNIIDVNFLKNKPDNYKTTERVIMIGVKSPSLNMYNLQDEETYSKEAFDFTFKELYEEYGELQLDLRDGERDEFGRIKGYIWINNHLFNQLIIEQGYGKVNEDENFNTNRKELFKKAQNYAIMNKLGIWRK